MQCIWSFNCGNRLVLIVLAEGTAGQVVQLGTMNSLLRRMRDRCNHTRTGKKTPVKNEEALPLSVVHYTAQSATPQKKMLKFAYTGSDCWLTTHTRSRTHCIAHSQAACTNKAIFRTTITNLLLSVNARTIQFITERTPFLYAYCFYDDDDGLV